MLAYSADLEALSADVNRHTNLPTPVYLNRTPGLGLELFCVAILIMSVKVTLIMSG